jgi:hypothetical protein
VAEKRAVVPPTAEQKKKNTLASPVPIDETAAFFLRVVFGLY